MKIGKLRISITYDKNEMEVAFKRKLSALDEKRIRQYLAGGSHIHLNPRRKPRHTPEELDRMIEVVREENTPRKGE